MARVKIISANEVHELHAQHGEHKAVIPIDGAFHEIHDSLVGPLQDSAAEIEVENADATGGSADSGRRDEAGGSRRAAKPKAKSKAKKKAK